MNNPWGTIIDFASWPLERSATALRELALHLLACLLKGQNPQLDVWLTPEQRRLLASVPASRAPSLWLLSVRATGWHKVWVALRLLYRRMRRDTAALAFGASAASIASGELPADAVGEHWRYEFRRVLGVDGIAPYPKSFWPLLAERAWLTLEFSREAAELVENALSKRALFVSGSVQGDERTAPTSGPFPPMLLNERVYWLLIALAADLAKIERSDPLRALARRLQQRGWTRMMRFPLWLANRLDAWLPGRRQQTRALNAMRENGLAFGLEPAWAGVWDQWVLCEALRLWQRSATDDRLVLALGSLPLCEHYPGAMLSPRRTQERTPSIPALAHEAWKNDAPDWFLRWFKATWFEEVNNRYGEVRAV